MDFNPVPKPKHNRRTPKRAQRSRFDDRTITEIFKRDNYQCVKCGSRRNLEAIPHHIEYRSSGGTGHKRNGVTICIPCHIWAHESKKKNNIWFEQWRDENLDNDGDLLVDDR